MSMHHTEDPSCPLCEEKLKQADPILSAWFRRVKKRYLNSHVSWSYRGQEDQDRFFKQGKSDAKYPTSPHNAIRDGKPCSRALDLFQIDEDGNARFSELFYSKLASEIGTDGDPIQWGGDWNNGKGDFDHFELMKGAGVS